MLAMLREGLSQPRTIMRTQMFSTRFSIFWMTKRSIASSLTCHPRPMTGVTTWSTKPCCGQRDWMVPMVASLIGPISNWVL
jgi:hypothetical protein